MSFRGNNPTRIDEKGRLKMPADLKRQIEDMYGRKFYITSRTGERAEIYPMREWEKIEDELATKPASAAKTKFMDATGYYGQVVDMDDQGRLLIPQLLREKAKIAGDVGVLGRTTFLVVVNAEQHEAKLAENPVTDADVESLGIAGL
ncbi:MAG TPA: division/cell wall cluster transcriptional repressor MraZ [Acidobacteriaceae bacterium]|nr:division/cell wall cluster transcriptional repressor MraZ [Acidobacteriaceae bacterium]